MSRPNAPRRHAGFSMVELMVALVIGMLALMFATQIVLTGEQNKQATLGGSDAMQNGMLALFSITADADQAGFGLNDPILNGCDTRFIDANGYTMATAQRNGANITPLAPVVIVSNPAGNDTISTYSGTSMTGNGSLVISQYLGGGQINVGNLPFGFAQNDVIVATTNTPTNATQCAVSQITSNPAALPDPPAVQSVQIGAARFSNANLFGLPFASNQSRLFNLGPATALAFHTWSLNNTGFLMLQATNLAGAERNPSMVIDNVVALKAQYGFDTRNLASFLPVNGMVVGRWSPVMIDADGDGVVGGNGDYQRIGAVRVAVVARSKSPERPDSATNTCSATTVLPQLFSSGALQGVAAVPFTAQVAIAGDAIDWKCYRYRVFETIVPLRNAGYRANNP